MGKLKIVALIALAITFLSVSTTYTFANSVQNNTQHYDSFLLSSDNVVGTIGSDQVKLAFYAEKNVAQDNSKMDIVYAAFYKATQNIIRASSIVIFIDYQGSWIADNLLRADETLQEAISRTSGVRKTCDFENFDLWSRRSGWSSYYTFQLSDYIGAIYVADGYLLLEEYCAFPQWHSCLAKYTNNADRLASVIENKLLKIFGCNDLSELASSYNGIKQWRTGSYESYYDTRFIWGFKESFVWTEEYFHYSLTKSSVEVFTHAAIMRDFWSFNIVAVAGTTFVKGGLTSPIYYQPTAFRVDY